MLRLILETGLFCAAIPFKERGDFLIVELP